MATDLANRLRGLGANTVILSGCSDVNRDGNVEAAYFPTTQLPVLHDCLDHVVARLQGARLQVMIELPVLSFARPATPRNASLRVMEARGSDARPSFAIQERYSPFHPEVAAWTSRLYSDLAGHVRCDGIVFGEDAYLTDSEDFNAAARKIYEARLGTPTPDIDALNATQRQAWTRLKTETLDRLIQQLGRQVRHYRPGCRMIRSIFAPLLHYPESERWFAQNYRDGLNVYDAILLLAYVEMEDVSRPESWLEKLVERAEAQENGIEKTIFKLQAVDWEKQRPVKARHLRNRLRHLARSGALHIAYGPDNPADDIPAGDAIRNALATPTQARK